MYIENQDSYSKQMLLDLLEIPNYLLPPLGVGAELQRGQSFAPLWGFFLQRDGCVLTQTNKRVESLSFPHSSKLSHQVFNSSTKAELDAMSFLHVPAQEREEKGMKAT